MAEVLKLWTIEKAYPMLIDKGIDVQEFTNLIEETIWKVFGVKTCFKPKSNTSVESKLKNLSQAKGLTYSDQELTQLANAL